MATVNVENVDILEMLKQKSEPLDFKPIGITLTGISVIEEKEPADFDTEKFRNKISERKKTRPVEKLSRLEPEDEKTPMKKIIRKRKGVIKLGTKKEEDSDSDEDLFVPSKKPKKSTEGLVYELSDADVVFNDEVIKDRLPEREKVPDITIKGPPYYLANKQIFTKFLKNLFKKYEKELDGKNPVTCKTLEQKKKGTFSLLVHQKIIKEYMNVYSPYRGLLLFHGLGAGKTCASIAIAEGLKFNKKVVVMTPKSLQRNYIEELKVCGDPLFRLNQHWEWIPYNKLNPVQLKELSALLSLNVDIGNRGVWTIKKNKGLFLVNTKKKPNYEEMNNNEKTRLNKQIEAQIMYKYQFIAYNGIRKGNLRKLEVEAFEETNNKNPFNNKVVIIDEVHNFISRIVNKLKSKDKNVLSLKLYHYLQEATNCRLVFLSGTPIINYPNEIGVLFNILRGYIKTFKFNVMQNKKLDTTILTKMLNDVNVFDYVNYKGVNNGKNNTLFITRNPFKFINKGKQKVFDNTAEIDDELFKKLVIDTLDKNGVPAKYISTDLNKVLPDDMDEFKREFIDSSNSENKGKLVNPIKFKRRILGLTSYFRSASESLLPKLGKLREIKIPMSEHQLGVYEKARDSERNQEKNNVKLRMKDLHSQTSSTYRIFSRLFCNFVFPEGIERPMPDKINSIEDAVSNEKIELSEDFIDNTNVKEQIEKSESKFDLDDAKKLIGKNIDPETGISISYSERIEQAIEKLKTGIVNEETGKRILPLKMNGDLQRCSPKFFKLYQILNENRDELHLIYSQFRSLEGIELIKVILEENGYALFDIKKEGAGNWKINIKEEDLGKKMFCLYTGKEEDDKKETIRNIFNSDWHKIDKSLADELKKIYQNNHRGEIIQIMMITSSGAEGINLKNVRNVHLIEPYWHPVRTEQVIGRARRICSHQDLPEQDRTVSIYLYLMTLNEELLGKASKNLNNDKSKLEYEGKKKIFTTDESLWEISQIKEKTTKSILTAIKESSIDCSVHSKTSGENIKCFKFNTTDDSKWSYIPNWDDPDEDDDTWKRNRPKMTLKWKPWKNPKTNKMYAAVKNRDSTKKNVLLYLYDYEDANRNEATIVGEIVKKAKGAEFKEYEFS